MVRGHITKAHHLTAAYRGVSLPHTAHKGAHTIPKRNFGFQEVYGSGMEASHLSELPTKMWFPEAPGIAALGKVEAYDCESVPPETSPRKNVSFVGLMWNVNITAPQVPRLSFWTGKPAIVSRRSSATNLGIVIRLCHMATMTCPHIKLNGSSLRRRAAER